MDSPGVDFDAQIASAVDALEEFDVRYRTHPMETTIEADDMAELMAAVTAAHQAVDAPRVGTTLKIDHYREEDLAVEEKVDRVEDRLGRTAASDR